MLEALNSPPGGGILLVSVAAMLPWLLTVRLRTRVLILAIAFMGVAGLSAA